ncbi:MAG: NAD(P)/FAD-dependent oxidoreductase [Pseudomonadota bacterium]
MLQKTDVIIVGAGPSGTVAAYRLARAGFSVTTLEAEATCAEDLRASTVHPPTLEMFDELGIVDDLIAQGLKTPVYHFRDRQSGEFIAFDFDELRDVTPYPYRLQCEQYKIARLLAERLEHECGQPICFSHRVTGVRQTTDEVTVSAISPEGELELSASFLIAADGGGSVIRKSLQVPFEGLTYPEKFLTFSTDTPLDRYFDDFAYVNYVADAHEWASIILTPSGWRVLVPADGAADDDELTADTNKNRVFGNLIGETDAVKTHHRTVYQVNQRVAARYDHGRIALAGDAAHVHNPLGGFGMNSGIHDVWNITGKIIKILETRINGASAFAHYDRQRRTIMQNFVQAQTAVNKAYMDVGSEAGYREKRKELENTAADPQRRRQYLLQQSMIASRAEEAAIA